jgi:hypothetical protein
MPDLDWFSLSQGPSPATIVLAVLAQVWALLRKAFQPAEGKPFMQRAAETVRNLIMALLVLLVLGTAVYIAYSLFFKPMP